MSPDEVLKQQLNERVSRAWDVTVKAVIKLLEAHKQFGFMEFREGLHPSLEDMIKGFALIDSVLESLLESEVLGPEESMEALNARQCILYMKMLHLAFESEDEARYLEIIATLESQKK